MKNFLLTASLLFVAHGGYQSHEQCSGYLRIKTIQRLNTIATTSKITYCILAPALSNTTILLFPSGLEVLMDSSPDEEVYFNSTGVSSV